MSLTEEERIRILEAQYKDLKKEVTHIADLAKSTISVLEAILRLIEKDPHQWSSRPCATCKSISALAGRSFGCVLYAEQIKCPKS